MIFVVIAGAASEGLPRCPAEIHGAADEPGPVEVDRAR